MATMTTSNLFWAVMGHKLLIVRPESLATDWSWKIVERAVPTNVIDYATSNILNVTRHVLVDIDSKFLVDVPYRVQVLDSVPAVVAEGDMQVVQGAFDGVSQTSLATVQANIQLALGLAGGNMRTVVLARDAATGAWSDVRATLYTDETATSVLAVYRIKRRFNKYRQVVGEVSYLESVTGTGTTATGTGVT